MELGEVYIRADGGTQIGLGHLVRCLALAQMLQRDFNINFVCKEIPESFAKEITGIGFNLLIITDEDEFFRLLNSEIIVVLDHYGLDSIYQENIKKIGCKLVSIDDIHDKVFYADIIINHAPGIIASDYRAQTYTQYALGLDYVLLRPPFLNKLKKFLVIEDIKTVFICFGGSDSKNITQKVVNIVKNDKRFEKVSIVIGSAFTHLKKLEQEISNNPKFQLYNNITADEIATLIADAQLAIVPSSGILQEVLAVGNKVISGTYADNQKYVFANYKALGAFESADDFSEESIQDAIDKCYTSMPYVNSQFIDGKSGSRLLKYFKILAVEKYVSLENVKDADLMKTFEWASNADIRKFSFNKKPITFDEHKDWFFNKLQDNNCFYYLGNINNKEFGSVRFDLKNNKAIISYLIDPHYHNQGLGTILLKRGLELFLKQFKGNIAGVYGEVVFQNIASIKVFEKLGYTKLVGSSSNMIKFEKLINS